MGSLPSTGSAFFYSRKIPELFANEEERSRTENTNDEHDFVVGDEVWVNHQGNTEQHRFPEVHPFPVNKRNETDSAKNETTD